MEVKEWEKGSRFARGKGDGEGINGEVRKGEGSREREEKEERGRWRVEEGARMGEEGRYSKLTAVRWME